MERDIKIYTFSKKVTLLSMNIKTEQVHISQINAGDTILHNDEMCTVTNTNIKHGGFMGKTLFGDSYHSGNKLVTKVHIIKA